MQAVSRTQAAFDWIIKPANFLKILENNYGRAEKIKPSYNLDELWEFSMKKSLIERNDKNDR